MKRFFFFLSGLFFLFHSYAQLPGLSVKPVRLFFNLLNGQSESQTVYVLNNTEVPQQFKLYLEDWKRDSLGGHIYMPAGTNPVSCSRWVKLSKDFIELQPGESTDFLVKLEIPDSLSAVAEMKWTMLFIETTKEKITPSKTKGITTQVNNITRIGVHIVQTPPSLTEKSLDMISFKKLPNEENKYRIICQNTGKIQFDCKGYLELSPFAGGDKITINKNVFPLFPNQVRCVDFTLPNTLAKGKYTLVAVLDAGDDVPLHASESTIEIK